MTKETTILLGFIVLKFLLQFSLISSEYELHRDEFLHLDQANHLAWGYASVPPVTSWISSVIKLLGNSVFWVKFFPALFGALTMVVIWKTIGTLGGNIFARSLGATCILFSALLRLNTLYQPNSLDVLSWTTFYFVVVNYIHSEKPKWLFIGAVIFAIGFLNKYNIVFLLIGLLPAILLTPQRTLLARKPVYAAALLAILLIFPNLVWQYQNNFPVIRHLEELSETQLVNVDRWGFLKSQLLFFIGSLFVIVSGLYAVLRYGPLKKYGLFFGVFFFTLVVFVFLKAKDYYAIGLYPIFIAFGSVFLGKLLETGWKRYLMPVAILIPVVFFIPMYMIAFPNKAPEYIAKHGQRFRDLGMLRWEDGEDHLLPQDFADMLGWKELAFKVDSVYSALPEREKTLVLCDNYGQAGAINYYTTQGIRAVSFSADYVNWFDFDRQYSHLIRVKNYSERESELVETGLYFHSALMADSVTNRFAREYGTTIFAFRGAKIDMNKRLKEEITAAMK